LPEIGKLLFLLNLVIATPCLVASYIQQILCILDRQYSNSVGLASCCVESQITCWFDSLLNGGQWSSLYGSDHKKCT